MHSSKAYSRKGREPEEKCVAIVRARERESMSLRLNDMDRNKRQTVAIPMGHFCHCRKVQLALALYDGELLAHQQAFSNPSCIMFGLDMGHRPWKTLASPAVSGFFAG